MIDPQRWGVATGYHDVSGRWCDAPPPTVDAILESMGADGGDPPPPALITVRTDHQLPPLGPGRVVCEDGGEIGTGPGTPPSLPHGYHRFEPVEGPAVPLVVSPGRVPWPRSRTWGFAAQLYATRSGRSWGMGDLADLRRLCGWSAGLGAGMVLINPLHATSPTIPQQPSPYYAGSRCFSNPVYLAVEELPGAGAVAGIADLAASGRALNSDRLVDRDRVWQLKSEAFERIFAAFGGGGDAEFDRYCRSRGQALRRFAVYCALAERFGPAWREWPDGLRHPDRAEVEEFASSAEGSARVRYHSWLQWCTETQMQAAGEALGLVADLAVGVDPTGPDSWIWQDAFSATMRVGAPPDEFNTQGQDWGLPPFDPWRLRSGGYAPWIEALRSGLRHGAGLRVDHVMGLFRLYWIPEGSAASDGAYVGYPHDDMLNILALEAERAGAFVVGEDLGTVEDRVRSDLAGRRVLSYRVWWFEDRRSPEWPEAAMGAVSTHDLPTVAGVLTGSDIEAQRRLGTSPNEESSAALQRKLLEWTGAEPGDDPADVVGRVYEDLGRAPCQVLTATLDDVLVVEERPNMPGTTDEWPNWRMALPATLEAVEETPLAARIAEALRRT